MKELHTIKEQLCEELRGISRKGSLNSGDLDTIYKATTAIKNICKIDKMESGYFRDGGSYDGYPSDGSYGGRWEAEGEYGMEGGSSNRGRDSRGRYTSDGVREHMRRMMRESKDANEREIIRRMMERLGDN